MSASVQTPAPVLSDAAADAFLAAAAWTPGAREDLTLRETLAFAYLAGLMQAARGIALPADGALPGDPARHGPLLELGLACLALGVAQWGLREQPADLDDPHGDQWRGPPQGRGKHLVSVRDGGIGLPHLDTDKLGDLLRFALRLDPAIGSQADRARIPGLADRFSDGLIYKHLDPRQQGGAAETQDWNALVGFAESALGVREVQRWVLRTWIDRYWKDSVVAVGRAGGSHADLFINARIRNSSPRNARCALAHAMGQPDRLAAQLEAYADPAICQDAKARHRTRFGYMRRPVVLWQHLLA